MNRYLAEWLTTVLESPEGSTFAILVSPGDIRLMEREVLWLIHGLHPDALHYSRGRATCEVFGRRVYLITREEEVFGLTLSGYYAHSIPPGFRLAMIRTRCSQQPQARQDRRPAVNSVRIGTPIEFPDGKAIPVVTDAIKQARERG